MTKDALVLNKNFQAIHIVSWEKTMTLLYQGAAVVLDDDLQAYNFDDWAEMSKMMKENPKGFVNTTTLRVAIPEVIRLTKYDKLPKVTVKFTRRHIFEHYNFTCCYCGVREKDIKKLNLDHVIPRSRGGLTDWYNIVLSCIPCNQKKRNRTPEEAGMKLRVQPTKPKWQGMKSVLVKSPVAVPVSWQKLLDRAYWDQEIKS